MLTSRTYKALLLVTVFAMAIGLALEAALGLGCFVEKWSADSLALSIGIATAVGVLMIAAIYFAVGMLAARGRESAESLGCSSGFAA